MKKTAHYEVHSKYAEQSSVDALLKAAGRAEAWAKQETVEASQ